MKAVSPFHVLDTVALCNISRGHPSTLREPTYYCGEKGGSVRARAEPGLARKDDVLNTFPLERSIPQSHALDKFNEL